MKLFIDTADIEEVRRIAAWGVLSGATTNPSLMAKHSRDPAKTLIEICELVKGPVSAEVVSQETESMAAEGRQLAGLHEHVVIKVPMSPEGLGACRTLTDEGIRVNVTLVFSAVQALLAAGAGACFVSPFIGRLDDIGADGVGLISDIRQSFDQGGIETLILAASVRHPAHVLECAVRGADVSTLPPKVFDLMSRHPLTDAGLDKFMEDWEKSGHALLK